MGMISDFVLAPFGAGAQVGESVNPSDHWPTLQVRTVDTIKVATLFCCITGQAYDDDIQASFELVGGDQNEGPWVFEFPQEILRAIADLPIEKLESVALCWLETDELKLDRWPSDTAIEFIKHLSAICSQAQQQNQSLFLSLSI